MEIIESRYEELTLKYPIEKLGDINKLLFIDIETTGFSAKTSKLYLIGCAFYKDGSFHSKQFFSEDYNEEADVIKAFFEFSRSFDTLIDFNGNNFDLPYILDKCRQYDIDENFERFTGIDIFKRISPLKSFLKLENCKQKTIEKFLGINREDKFTGGDLIGVYKEFLDNKNPDLKKSLLLHNYEDVLGMIEILPILCYGDLLTEKLKVSKVSATYYNDINGDNRCELLMAVEFPFALPTPISVIREGIYFTASAGQGLIRVPVVEKELKYYFANYKDYYYLPIEDIALHKSVASYVDKDRRKQATAQTCYIKKASKFLPEFEPLVDPFFKEDYNSKKLYFELTNERKTDRELFSKYASHLILNLVMK